MVLIVCLCLLRILITVYSEVFILLLFCITVKCVVLLIVIGIVIFCTVICDCGFFYFIVFCDTLTEFVSGFFPQL